MRVLITTNHLRNFAGSEMVTLELIEYFLDLEWTVDVYTHDLGEPMLSEIQKLPSWGRLTLYVADLNAPFDSPYDLVWVQHSILPPGLINQLQHGGISAPMVWNHMSSFMDVELPRHSAIENRLAAVCMGMSGTTVDSLGHFGIEPRKLVVWDNPAPDAFANLESRTRVALSRLLVVSNHAPDEVRLAAAILAKQGVDVAFLGADDNPVRVSPEVLEPFDAVLCIGKTVQYAHSMGIPAFIYDHFGGPGWLGPDNFDSTAHDSFSGRKERRQISAEHLAGEVLDGFEGALAFAVNQRQVFAHRWRLSRRIQELLADERVANAPRAQLSADDARQFSSLVALHRDLYRLVVKLQGDLSSAEARTTAGTTRGTRSPFPRQ